MDFENILYSKDSGIARMIVNRPEKRNALNRATRLEMMKALEDARQDTEIKVMVMAGRIARQSPLALKWAKKVITAGQEVGLSRGLDYEALAECLLFTSQDREEGMKAFFEKRDPKFRGR